MSIEMLAYKKDSEHLYLRGGKLVCLPKGNKDAGNEALPWVFETLAERISSGQTVPVETVMQAGANLEKMYEGACQAVRKQSILTRVVNKAGLGILGHVDLHASYQLVFNRVMKIAMFTRDSKSEDFVAYTQRTDLDPSTQRFIQKLLAAMPALTNGVS